MSGKVKKAEDHRKKRALPGLAAVLLGGFLLLQSWLLFYWQRQSLEGAWQQEVATVQMLTGGLLQDDPQLEERMVALLRDGTEEQRELGGAVLSRYGYRESRSWRQEERYRQLWRRQAQGGILLMAGNVVAVCLLYALLFGRQRRRLEGLEQTLEQYLAGDYSACEMTGVREGSQWSRIEEQLHRLGSQICLQQERLVEEQEGAKALVTDISHQLKTPIAALKTCFELYLEAENPEESEEFLQRCLLQIDKLEGLTGALVNISRLETAMITLQPERIELGGLLDAAIAAIRDKADARSITLERGEWPEETLFLDRKWTAEALVNLLDNAVKYSSAGSVIMIRAEATHYFVRVELEDQGIGVPKGETHAIFQRFYRGSHPLVKEQDGSGVGLYLTRSILEQQGGSVAVGRALEGGSIFVVQLPRQSH